MAQQGSGVSDEGLDTDDMQDQTSFNARHGAPKTPQTSFEAKWGMRDGDGDAMRSDDAADQKLTGLPSAPGTGPDASSPDPSDPESAAERGKVLRKQPQPGQMKSAWGMVDANGKGVDNSIGGRVLGEAILSGAAKLPTSETYSTAGPARKPG